MQLRTEVEIDAPPARIWQVLTSFAHYPEWNPFIKSIAGELKLGSRLELTLTPPDGSERSVKATVTRFDEGRELGYRDKLWFKGLFDGEYFIQLIQTDEGRTRVVNAADFAGWLVQHMGRSLTGTARGLVGMNEALKKRIERKR
jgi:hypothetical protein